MKYAMPLLQSQVPSQMQMPSLNGIIDNSGSDWIAKANANANVQCERALDCPGIL